MSNFLFSNETVLFEGKLNEDYILRAVIFIKGYQKSQKYVCIDDIFYTWFTKGLKLASPNEEVMFDLEFGDGQYFELWNFVKMLEDRIEKK